MKLQTQSNLLLILIAVALLSCSSCANPFRRSTKAENIEHDPLEKGESSSSKPSHLSDSDEFSASNTALEHAKAVYNEGNYSEAAKRFQDFLSRYPAMPGSDDAQFYLASSYFHEAQYSEAIPVINQCLERKRGKLTYERQGSLLTILAESLYSLNRYDEALIATFELLPNKDLEKRLGAEEKIRVRQGAAPAALVKDQIRGALLRAQIFTALHQQDDATHSIKQGWQLLEDSIDYGIPKSDANTLKGEFRWRELEVLKTRCESIAVPEKMSESEFNSYSEQYYECAAGGKTLLCAIQKSGNAKAYSQAMQTYKALTLYPLRIRDYLPAPARALKGQESHTYYEAEMKELIESTVKNKSIEFKNISECGLTNLFRYP